MATLDDVIANVADEKTVIDSAVALISGLQAQLKALTLPTTDPATVDKIAALNDSISSQKAALAASLVVNTPAPVVSAPVVTPDVAAVVAADAVAAAPAVPAPAA